MIWTFLIFTPIWERFPCFVNRWLLNMFETSRRISCFLVDLWTRKPWFFVKKTETLQGSAVETTGKNQFLGGVHHKHRKLHGKIGAPSIARYVLSLGDAGFLPIFEGCFKWLWQSLMLNLSCRVIKEEFSSQKKCLDFKTICTKRDPPGKTVVPFAAKTFLPGGS